MEIRTGLIDA